MARLLKRLCVDESLPNTSDCPHGELIFAMLSLLEMSSIAHHSANYVRPSELIERKLRPVPALVLLLLLPIRTVLVVVIVFTQLPAPQQFLSLQIAP